MNRLVDIATPAFLVALMSACSAPTSSDADGTSSQLATDEPEIAVSLNGYDLSVTPAGKVQVVYTPEMKTRDGAMFGSLRIASKTGAGWEHREIVTATSTRGLASACLAVGSDGNMHIAYSNDGALFVTRETAPDSFETSSVDRTEMIDASGVVAIAVDSSGTEHLAYSLSRAPHEEVWYAHREAGGAWTRELVEAIPGRKVHSPRLRVADGIIHVVYESWEAPTKTEIHHIAKDVGGTWAASVVGWGSSPSLALGPDGVPHVAFYERESLHYAFREPGRWNDEVILMTQFPLSQFHQWPTLVSGLDIDAEGTVHLAVVDVGPEESTLRYARKPKAGTFAVTMLHDRADFGERGEFFFDPPRIVADANGAAHLLDRNERSGLVYRTVSPH